MTFINFKKKFNNQRQRIFGNPVLTAIVVFCVLAVVVVVLSLPFYINSPYRFYEQILTEAHGMLFDIAVIGILLVWLNNSAEKNEEFDLIEMKLMISGFGSLKKLLFGMLEISSV